MTTQHSSPGVCAYCKKPASGELQDHYGEWVLKRELLVCEECDSDLAEEQGPWAEWN